MHKCRVQRQQDVQVAVGLVPHRGDRASDSDARCLDVEPARVVDVLILVGRLARDPLRCRCRCRYRRRCGRRRGYAGRCRRVRNWRSHLSRIVCRRRCRTGDRRRGGRGFRHCGTQGADQHQYQHGEGDGTQNKPAGRRHGWHERAPYSVAGVGPRDSRTSIVVEISPSSRTESPIWPHLRAPSESLSSLSERAGSPDPLGISRDALRRNGAREQALAEP